MVPTSRQARAIVMLWAIGTIGVFWWRVGRYLIPAARPAGAATLHADTRPLAPVLRLSTNRGRLALDDGHAITVLNFWSPSCPCSRFMEGHVRQLVERFSSQGVRFVTLVQTGSELRDQTDGLKQWQSRAIPTAMLADAGGALARRFGVWAAPGAVIVNPQGHVVFVGAYNAARYCANPETAFAERALQALQIGQSPPVPTTPFYGCQITPGNGP